jgi:hypothetical protein
MRVQIRSGWCCRGQREVPSAPSTYSKHERNSQWKFVASLEKAKQFNNAAAQLINDGPVGAREIALGGISALWNIGFEAEGECATLAAKEEMDNE